jgi:hypothetical protein
VAAPVALSVAFSRKTIDVLLKVAFVVGRLVSVEHAFGYQAVELAFDVVHQGSGLVGVFEGAKFFHLRARTTELPTVACATLFVLANTLSGGGTLWHGVGEEKRQKRVGLPNVEGA